MVQEKIMVQGKKVRTKNVLQQFPTNYNIYIIIKKMLIECWITAETKFGRLLLQKYKKASISKLMWMPIFARAKTQFPLLSLKVSEGWCYPTCLLNPDIGLNHRAKTTSATTTVNWRFLHDHHHLLQCPHLKGAHQMTPAFMGFTAVIIWPLRDGFHGLLLQKTKWCLWNKVRRKNIAWNFRERKQWRNSTESKCSVIGQ